MKAGWEVKTLNLIAENLDSKRVPITKTDRTEGHYPYYGASGIVDYVGSYIFEGDTLLISEDGANLLARSTPIAFPATGKYWVNNHAHILKFDSLVTQRYVELYFESIPLDDYVTGAAQPKLNQKALNSIPIPVPPLAEQQRIVAILDQAFEGIAKARANAEQNLQNARALFESYLHSIDAEKKELGEFVSIKTGKLDANAAVEGGAYPFFTCSRDVYRIDKFAFDCEAILLAGNNASGDFNVKYYIGKFNAYQRTYVITVKNENEASYRYLYFQLLAKLKEFKKQSVGSNTKFLKIGMIQGMKIPMPTLVEQEAIVVKLDRLLTETQRLEALYQRKIACLDELKKSLLQLAFAGEL